jgi:hypothetical protein
VNQPAARLSSLLVALLLSAGLPTAAAGAAQPASLDRRIDLDLVDAAALQVFSTFATILEAELDLDRALAEREVTIRLDDVRTATALAAVCDSLRSSWRLDPAPRAGEKPFLVVRPLGGPAPAAARVALASKLDEPISLDLADAPMEQVLGSFARMLGAELDLDPALAGGEVTIRLTDTPVRRALDAVLGGGWSWRVDDDAEGRRLVIRRRRG